MRELGYIDRETEIRAAAERVAAREHVQVFQVEAPYIAEMARLELVQRLGAAAQNEGYKIYTTIEPRLQTAANVAVRDGLLDYDRRHGWRGPKKKVSLPQDEDESALAALLDDQDASGPVLPAVVVEVQDKSARAYVRDNGFVTIPWEGLSWARPKVDGRLGKTPRNARELLARGDVIHVTLLPTPQLAQIPEAAAALVALSPADGAITALVGGFDYFDPTAGKFNRAIQAKRQPGSGFKPFLYSAALEYGFTPASVVLDEPFVIDDPRMEEAWRPENSSGDFGGPTRLREALVKSRNLVSIRVLQALGMGPAMAYTERFGFERASLPRNLTLSLGTLSATPMQVAAGYAVFANGGHRIQPWFIDRIEDPKGEVVFQAAPRRVVPACDPPDPMANAETASAADGGVQADTSGSEMTSIMEAPALVAPGCTVPPTQVAPRVIRAQNAWLMNDMLREVITRGTGRRALALGRSDIAGKTGTTNEARDTWFNGYNPSLVATVWVGFDQSRPLGEGEEGSRTAVPIWVDFMRVALARTPVRSWPMPEGLVQVRISPATGEVAGADDRDAIFETFMLDRLPAGASQDLVNPAKGDESKPKESAEPLF